MLAKSGKYMLYNQLKNNENIFSDKDFFIF